MYTCIPLYSLADCLLLYSQRIWLSLMSYWMEIQSVVALWLLFLECSFINHPRSLAISSLLLFACFITLLLFLIFFFATVLCNHAWLQSHCSAEVDPPVSASQVPGWQVCASLPGFTPCWGVNPVPSSCQTSTLPTALYPQFCFIALNVFSRFFYPFELAFEWKKKSTGACFVSASCCFHVEYLQ